MTYAEQAETAADEGFRARVRACSTEQALTFINDSRPEFALLAEQIIRLPGTSDVLVPLVVGQPAMTTESPDADILAAVQHVWPIYGETLVPTE